MENENKMNYETPVMDIVVFDIEDVIATSGVNGWEGDVDPLSRKVNLPRVSF